MLILVHFAGEADLETLLSEEGVPQGYPLSTVIYGPSLSMLTEQIRCDYH